MSLHVFAAFVTATGTAANNRGLTEGNITTLQKLVWNGQVHTTVSAESIRFALRRRLQEEDLPCNRTYDDATRRNDWKDAAFSSWGPKSREEPFIDDDLLGFMAAEGAKQEGEKGSAKVRRAVLEVTRAVSLTPWPGDVTFNAASPGATPSAQKKGDNPVPYGTEMHATRYQYGVALTPASLRVPSRAATALRLLCALGPVAGNHGRFLFDFSPESVVFRLTHEAAPRILYAFQPAPGGGVDVPELLRKVKSGDVPAKELVLGGAVVDTLGAEAREVLSGAALHSGVVAACGAACGRLEAR
ncbi:type I-B CRISPR-associated protein Cas7/Cst2/DevR [Pyxidicoccus sp. 3LG]